MLTWLDKNFEQYLLSLFLGSISILVFMQVVMRYIFGEALVWTEELIRWLFIWSIWVGVSYAFKYDQHMKITIFTDRLNPNLQRILKILSLVICLIFIMRIGWYGWEQATSKLIVRQSSFSLPNPFKERNLSVMWLYLSVPVGCALSTLRIIQTMILLYRNKR